MKYQLKNKDKHFFIKDEIYGQCFHLILGSKVYAEKIIYRYGKAKSIVLGTAEGRFITIETEEGYLIFFWIKDIDNSFSDVLYELMYLCQWVFEKVGIDMNDSEGEVLVYYYQYIYKKIRDKIK